MSQLGWIDFSARHREKVLSVLDLYKDQGMVDELGLGTIRDALADRLFPGTSTIQTRAKYFLLVPWIIADLEARGEPARFLPDLDAAEIGFIKVLRDTEKALGIIGANLPNANPKRKPSSIYWNGLRSYGILRFPGSIADYARAAAQRRREAARQREMRADKDGGDPGDDADAGHAGSAGLWSAVPKPPRHWKQSLSIGLTATEANYLYDKMTSSHPDSLLAFALRLPDGLAAGFGGIGDFLEVPSLPPALQHLVRVAVRFDALMKGAILRYNLLVQRQRTDGFADQIDGYWETWREEMEAFPWSKWDIQELWSLCPEIPSATRGFVQKWIEIARNGGRPEKAADRLLIDRELGLKGSGRARLENAALAEQRDSFVGMSANESEARFLTYRWRTVQTFLKDILPAREAHA